MTEKGRIDLGETNGKKVVAISHNEDGSFNIQTEDGVTYQNCWLKDYHAPASPHVVTETVQVQVEIDPKSADWFKTLMIPQPPRP